MDHVYMRDHWGMPGVGGQRDLLTFLDRGTACKYAMPVDSKSAHDTYMAIKTLTGDDEIDRVYCDNHKSLIRALHDLGIVNELSQPGMHETNAIIENMNGDMLAGSRTSLFQAGLPSCFWTYASPIYTFLENITEDDKGETAWFKRHQIPFTGEPIPLGALIFFKPADTKYKLSKANPRGQTGVFMGYRLSPGGDWNDEYLVADLSDFIDKDLSVDAYHGDYCDFCPHITKKIVLPDGDFTFPLKAKYDQVNNTLEGLESEAKRSQWWEDDPPEADNTGTSVGVSSRGFQLSDFDLTVMNNNDDLIQGGGTPVAVPIQEERQFRYDSIGRKYAIDSYGNRIRKSDRPAWIHPEVWNSSGKNARAGYLATVDPVHAAPAGTEESDGEFDAMADYEERFHESIEEHCPAAPAPAGPKRTSHRKPKTKRGTKGNSWFPAMPCKETRKRHRSFGSVPLGLGACVARPVGKLEIEREPAARAARDKEWANLWQGDVWDASTVREWSDVSKEAQRTNRTIHLGRLFWNYGTKGF